MKRYLRIILGAKSAYAEECFQGNFIGAGFNIEQDLTADLPDNWREFNLKFIPIWMKKYPDKSKISAGLACGALWTISKGINIGDVVICPNGSGAYYVGEITSNYYYQADASLPHRRSVKWYSIIIDRSAMSEALRNSSGSIGTVSDITKHTNEIKKLIGEHKSDIIFSTDDSIEDASVFVLEKHLEDFLVQNWKQTELGKDYDIFEEDGKIIGQQYRTDTGSIDILAISKDKKVLLVVELKKGRASDAVVGQVQRYMGDIKELSEDDQIVKGAIIALEDDLMIRRALSVTNNIEFYRYQISFKLLKN